MTTRRNVLLLSALTMAAFSTVAQAQPAPPVLAGSWLAEDIRGGGVIDRLQSILTLAADGSLSGTGGCNRMMGRAVITGNMIRIGRIASTRMACAPAAMDQEQKFFAALSDAKFWRVDARQRKLILRDGSDQTLLIFSRM
ncbi:MAG: META domain-containing protein [Beijerinckiaceae bacterium]